MTENADGAMLKPMTFKERLIQEADQLDNRLEKLNAFMVTDNFETIAGVQQTLLKIQLAAMHTYSQCLKERLGWLEAID